MFNSRTKDETSVQENKAPKASELVNFDHKKIRALVEQKGWQKLDKAERIKQHKKNIYHVWEILSE
jgi:hypothetical protein